MSTPLPWHYWPVTLIATVWYVSAVADYLLTKLMVPAYLALFTDDQIAYFTDLPLTVTLFWAEAAWLGLLGAGCLWLRTRAAAVILALSALGMISATLWFVAISNPPMQAVTGPIGVWIMVGASVLSVLFWLYARAMHSAGHLP